MELWCVSSHHDLSARPWEKKGLLLLPEDLRSGTRVWVPWPGGSAHESEEEFRRDRRYKRSSCENQYLEPLRALQKVERKDVRAVVSIRWEMGMNAPMLITAHRTWLVIFDRTTERQLYELTHYRDGSPLEHFIDGLTIEGEERFIDFFSNVVPVGQPTPA